MLKERMSGSARVCVYDRVRRGRSVSSRRICGRNEERRIASSPCGRIARSTAKSTPKSAGKLSTAKKLSIAAYSCMRALRYVENALRKNKKDEENVRIDMCKYTIKEKGAINILHDRSLR